jgi:putative tryptophan/tyrosine transport system substrate-binding protein
MPAPFRQGLREHGYGEGQNISIECRAAPGAADRLPALAVELVRLKVDVILVGTSQSREDSDTATAFYLDDVEIWAK